MRTAIMICVFLVMSTLCELSRCLPSGSATSKSAAPVDEATSNGQLDGAFWGIAETRAWVDVNGDNVPDFCRIVKLSRTSGSLKCTLAAGSDAAEQYAGMSFETPVPLPAPNIKGTWVKLKDGGAWYCRTIVRSGRHGELSCFKILRDGFGTEVRSQNPIDLGLASGRAWVDFNGDGRPDFCTLIPRRAEGVGKLSCLLMESQGFASTPVQSDRIRWAGPSMRRWIPTQNGLVAFCSVAGPRFAFVECTPSTGSGFGPKYRDLLRHDVVLP